MCQDTILRACAALLEPGLTGSRALGPLQTLVRLQRTPAPPHQGIAPARPEVWDLGARQLQGAVPVREGTGQFRAANYRKMVLEVIC